MVGRVGVEPTTSRLSGVRSNHLSYRPQPCPAGHKGRGRREPAQAYNSDRHDRPPEAGRSLRRADPVMKGHEDGGNVLYERYEALPSTSKGAFVPILRKEVIQPQVPLRLPCYDFTPVANPTVVACLLAVSAAPSGETNSHGVTGGVYKAWERIHRGMLIRDY